jgi:hypothetical protein
MIAFALRFLIGVLPLALLLPSAAFAQTSDVARLLGQFDTDRSQYNIDLSTLEAGGPPKDGIPSIDDPSFVSIDAARSWIEPQEPVIALVMEGEARAYPLQILTFHEIVNDRVGGVPVAVTFCPLCYSAIVFKRTRDGRPFEFGVSGLLRMSDLVMYDRQTETLWQQFNGRAIVGDRTGETLERLPSQIVSFAQFAEAYPEGAVLSRDTGHDRPYGRNPYVGYDDVDKKPFRFRGETDGRLPPMEKVVAISLNGTDKAYPHRLTKEERVIHDTVAGAPLVVWHADGAVSALDAQRISQSKAVGSTGVFDPRLDGRVLHFRHDDGRFVDEETGSTWIITGRAVSGPLAGRHLDPVAHGDYFAFAWFAFKPETALYDPNGTP